MASLLFVLPAVRSCHTGFVHRVTSVFSRGSPLIPAVGRERRAQRFIAATLPVVSSLSASVTNLVNPKVLSTSLGAISKLLVTLALGVAAASRGLLDPSTLTALSKVVYNIFLPSLLFTNVIQTLSRPRAPGLFLLPLAAVMQVAIGLIIGLLGTAILRLSKSEKRVYLVCTAFGNSAALPLLFATALFSTTASFPQLVSGITFFLLGWTGLFWSLAYSLLTSGSSTSSSGAKSFDIQQFIGRIATPPLIASLTGLGIGLFAPSRNLIMASPLFPALSTLAAGYGPAAVLILAGSLVQSSTVDVSAASTDETGKYRVARMVFGISLTRFLFMPLIAILMVKFGPFRSPYIALALLLESVMPSAQNSTLILNMEKQTKAAAVVASILLANYLIGVIPISIALTFFLGYTGV